MKILIDTSSLLWRALLVGKDSEFGTQVEHEGKSYSINSAQYGLDNAIQSLESVLRILGISPSDMIFVTEGKGSLERRKSFLPTYKSSRSSRCPQQYEVFNECKTRLLDTYRNLGACSAQNGGVEADDLLAFLAQKLTEDVVILTEDGDLAALLTERISLWRRGAWLTTNPYGDFAPQFITLYKALVGDTSDAIPGAKGFGKKAFQDMVALIGDKGLAALVGMIKRRTLHELEEDVADFKPFRKVIEAAANVYASYDTALLRPEWCDTLRKPIQWQVGMVRNREVVGDPRLYKWTQQVRLVTTDNYDEALKFLQRKLDETKEFVLDLETTVPQESDDWLAQRGTKSRGVDVIASTIVGCGITFGANLQFGYYISVNHAQTNNITLDQLAELLEMFPRDKLTVAHNAAGFELPVLLNAFGARWKDNGWRGLFPNMVDSRIAASYWNENAPSHGLKQLSSSLLGYTQTSYETVTSKTDAEGNFYRVKMDALTAQETLAYGLDDVFCTGGIWNFFKTVMQIEKSWDAFIQVEQKPMYLSAQSYVQGTPISLERLRTLHVADEKKYLELETILDSYLIEKGWSGTQTPVYKELTPVGIKEICKIVLGMELVTQVRTVSKLAVLVGLLEHVDAGTLQGLIEENNLEGINKWVADKFDGKPDLNVGSPKQLTDLLYGTMKLPIRLRNKATDVMRAKGIREGNPRADDDAMQMAIKMGDAKGEVAAALTALTEMKSINTRTGLYWNPYPNLVHWKTRNLHPELRQCSTNTRRHSGSTPNIQQLSSDGGGVRSVIIPHHKDAVIVSCDLAGQEIRLLADMSRDENMMSAYMGEDLKDLHSFTAAMILNITYEEFRKRYKSDDPAISGPANVSRGYAKTVFFASSYGAAAPKIAEGLGIKEDVAQSFIDALDRAFPRVNEWKRETEEFASTKGWVPIYKGAPRHLRDVINSDDRWLASKALRQASNARIQGSGGQQLRTILSGIWDSDLLDGYDFRFYWPVHDEIVFSVGRVDAVDVIQKIHKIMCRQFLEAVPSSSSIGIGRTFGNLDEIGEEADEELIEGAVEKALNPVKSAEVIG